MLDTDGDETAITWHVPPECQGQIVEVSYGWCGGDLYRRTYDRSDRSEVIRCLADPWGEVEEGSRQAAQLEDWDPWNSSPPAWLEILLDESPIVD